MAFKLSAVPGPVVLVLCILSFFMGKFVQQGSQLPEPVPLQGEAGPRLSRRAISESAVHTGELQELAARGGVQQQQQQQGAAAGTALAGGIQPLADPLDPVMSERWYLQNSGFLQVRPPVPAGQTGDDFYHVIPYQILSWYPRAVLYPAFLDKTRCEHIIKMANDTLYPSGLAYRPGEGGDPSQQTRTSSGTFMSAEMDPAGVLGWVEEKIAAVTLLPVGHGEPFNVLRYENMQHYDSHMDSFDPKDFGPQPSQRIATVLVYLSDVEEGGDTVFKKEGRGGEKRVIEDWRNCDDGSFKYHPRQGDAVLFWSVTPDGEIDPHALHGGCPVVKGEKWAMTKWIRSKGRWP